MAQTTVTSPYADYDFYVDVFHGAEIDEDEFTRLEARAEEYVDLITFHRIRNLDEKYMDEELALNIRKAVCASAEAAKQISANASGAPAGVSSENTDGYVISYTTRTQTQVQDDFDSSINGIVKKYLGYSGLLYRGGGDWHDN